MDVLIQRRQQLLLSNVLLAVQIIVMSGVILLQFGSDLELTYKK